MRLRIVRGYRRGTFSSFEPFYFIQRRWLFFFWFDHTHPNEGGGSSTVTYQTRAQAEEAVRNIYRRWLARSEHREVVKEFWSGERRMYYRVLDEEED